MPDSEITLQSLIRIFTRRWRWVVGFSLLVLIVTYGMTRLLMEDKYTASVKLLVSKSKVGEKMMPIDYTMLELDTYVHLVTSRDSLMKALEQFRLTEPPWGFRLRDLERCINVRPLRNTDLLEIQVTMSDPEKALNAANFLAEEAIQKNFELLLRESTQSRDLFQVEVEEAYQALVKASQNLGRFMEEARSLPSEDYIKSSQEALWKLKQDRAFNVALRDESKAKMEALSDILQREPQTRFLRRAISDEQDLLALLRQRNPQVRLEDMLGLMIESENVNYAYDKASADLIEASRDFFGAIAHVQAMEEEIVRMEAEIRVAEQELAEKQRLQDELRIASMAYQEISRKNAEAKTTIASERQDLGVVERAVLPDRPSGPNRLLIAASAAVFAFLLSLFASLAMDFYHAMES